MTEPASDSDREAPAPEPDSEVRAQPAIVCQECEPPEEEEPEVDDLLFSSSVEQSEPVEVGEEEEPEDPYLEERRAAELQRLLEQMAGSAEYYRPDGKVAPENHHAADRLPGPGRHALGHPRRNRDSRLARTAAYGSVG